MKINHALVLCFAFFLLSACTERGNGSTNHTNTIKGKLQKLSEVLVASEKKDDLENFLTCYDTNVICMPEYQITLNGMNEIKAFYKEIFQRQKIKSLQRRADEILELDSTIIEIGTFKKEYADLKTDALITQNGKYLNIWEVKPDGNLKLKGEAFGFFHPVANPEALIVEIEKIQADASAPSFARKIPFELKAYNALMEKAVRIRDGDLRSEFFTKDGSFMPFADSTVSGMEKIKPYLKDYSARWELTFDSISVYTHHAEYFDDHVLEYSKFHVKWSTPQSSGKTEGKGIRIWKRQEDKSLRLYREIGTHDHIR